MTPTRLRLLVNEHQITAVFFAILAGLAFPDLFRPLSQASTPILFAIFFVASLRIDPKELFGYAKDVRLVGLGNALKLIALPLAMWLPAALFAPDWALAFLIAGAMPTGLTVALIADLFGGRVPLAMLVSVTTSLLSPFTVPLIFQWTIGASVPIPMGRIFISLLTTIVAPFMLAMLVRRGREAAIGAKETLWRGLSVILFVILMAGIVASARTGQSLTLHWIDLGLVITTTILLGGMAWLAYAASAWRTPAERITLGLCMVYLNNSLALYVANTFFRDAGAVRPLLVILATINAYVPFVKWLAKRALAAPVVSDIPGITPLPQNPFQTPKPMA